MFFFPSQTYLILKLYSVYFSFSPCSSQDKNANICLTLLNDKSNLKYYLVLDCVFSLSLILLFPHRTRRPERNERRKKRSNISEAEHITHSDRRRTLPCFSIDNLLSSSIKMLI
jgi:hypothetical protein